MDKPKQLYFDVRGRSEEPFQFFIGGRGIGKTYSALRDALDREKYRKFLYLRRTETEIKTVATPLGNPFKRINADFERAIQASYSDSANFGVFTESVDGEEIVHGYAGALSTFSNLRSVDFSDVDLIIIDEFIPESHKRSVIRNEGLVFLNMYETVNRNREIDGDMPVKVYLLANSITVESPILMEIHAISDISHMIATGQTKCTIHERGLYIEVIGSVGISEKKRETALYKLAKNTRFSEQALDNRFTENPFYLVKKLPIPEFTPYFMFGNRTVYVHKSNGTLYVAEREEKCALKFKECEADRFKAFFAPKFRLAVAGGAIFFDKYETKMYIDNALRK